jgi:hypothetical protein
VFLIPFWAMFPIIVIGPKATVGLLALYLIGYPAAKLWFARQPWYAKAAADLKAKGTTTIGGMVITSGGSSSSGGSSGGRVLGRRRQLGWRRRVGELVTHRLRPDESRPDEDEVERPGRERAEGLTA